MRTKRAVIILISGKAQAGKTTIAEKLREKLLDIPSIDVIRYGFAHPLKYIAKAFLGWTGEKDNKGRKLLQDLGKVGREYDEDIWAKHLLNQLNKSPGLFPPNFVIVDDWRFPNERNFLKKNPLLDVVTIRVFGRGGLEGDVALDVSENSLKEFNTEWLEPQWAGFYNFCVENSGNLEQLDSKLDIILAELEKQYIVE